MSKEVVFDFARSKRIGIDEAVLCQGKSPQQLAAIIELARDRGERLLLTRLDARTFEALPGKTAADLDFDSVSSTAIFAASDKAPVMSDIAIVCAGTSDIAVAREAERTLNFHGLRARSIYDVGVAGLWRLGERLPELEDCAIVIVIAGMDGALPSVIGGLLGALIIAVPVSTGYGAAEGGRTALNAALASCAPGIVTVNIDNGYGAAIAALRARRVREREHP